MLLFGLVVVITCYIGFSSEESQSFYVGVTYCGSSVQEAKELVDKVKDYTNLFVLQSWDLQDSAEVDEIGDYVVALGLSFAVYRSDKVDYYDDRGYYYGINVGSEINVWANAAKERWGEHFIGIYYRDEPGGDMLAGKFVTLEKVNLQADGLTFSTAQVIKFRGTITVYSDDNIRGNSTFSSRITYETNGEISIVNTFNEQNNNDDGVVGGSFVNSTLSSSSLPSRPLRARFWESIHYYPNGTVIIREYRAGRQSNFYTTENITKYPWPVLSYVEVLEQNPIQTYDDAAKVFVNMNKDFLEDINKKQLNSESILVFTADYGLYWWDYQGGYDLVLAELAWNHSVTQEIALVRGAAKLQNKQWGTMITWTYTHPPYLIEGPEMFEQMKISYETGAGYVVVFNYSEDPSNPNVLLEEHFLALERFWEEVVQNPKIIHGGITAEAVFVLPKNYGWGMRHPDDVMWGIWHPDSSSQEIWHQLQNKITQHGLKLDIVFEDPNYPIMWKYPHTYHWNKK